MQLPSLSLNYCTEETYLNSTRRTSTAGGVALTLILGIPPWPVKVITICIPTP